jgi:hypothetical protein
MCLDILYVKTKKAKYGYKIFKRIDESSNLYGLYMTDDVYLLKGYPLHKWIKCQSKDEILSVYGNYYPSGFHIFEKLKDAKRYMAGMIFTTIHKVEMNYIVASGI